MHKIIKFEEISTLCQNLSNISKTIVLAGGCFDMLHKGHLAFLEASKKQGDTLLLLLEADKRIKKLKGPTRPINSQEKRAKLLASLPFVDYIILLPDEMTDERYDQLILLLKPAIITSTKGDPYRKHKERQAQLVGGKVKTVIDLLPDFSTTKLISSLR